ncbi:MAG: PQQ-dependent sugar dehydrogenase [Bacteroidetes bacterium]|nr:PQQ-dependent sugar dehydrogenase [Bacteroidota bacterium]
MKPKQILSISIALFIAACGQNANNAQTPAAQPQPQTNPVEKESPNSNYKPAFAGQTRINSATTKTPYQTIIITKNLNRPWGITTLPDGRFLITEKEGVMRIVTKEGKLSKPITGILTVNDAGQGGLLGITIDPDFAVNRMVYWVFSERLINGNLTAVAKGKLSSDELSIQNATVIYRATPAYNGTLHYGGRIVFDKTGNLIISTGERSDKETRPQAQHLNSALGKLIRITTDGRPAPGNPFASNAQARPEIYSYGHRNVQGLAWHPVTGQLWENEFGPKGGDEINLITPGKNYGWPTITYGLEYSGKKIGDGTTQQQGMEQPVYYWDPALSPSGMVFYNGKDMPEWKNNLFVCGLSSSHVARLIITNNKVTGEERLLANEGQRFRDITQGKDEALYAITDEGWLYRIGKK